MNINIVTDEELAAEIHKVYCRQYKKRYEVPYYTNGDYSKLDEPTKDFDRALVTFIRQCVKNSQKELVEALKTIYNDTTQQESWDKVEQALASVEWKNNHEENK